MLIGTSADSTSTLDPADEVLTLIGSKEGIGHIPLAFVDPGDVVLVPSPGYPVYPVGTSFAGGVSHLMPLTKQNGFLPDLKAIPKDVAKKAKLMFLNSPNNPTSVIMNKDYFKRVVDFAQENQVIVCHDAAYSEIFYDGKPPASFMEVDGAKDVGIEFHSLSKTYNMTGWRIGFVVGNSQVLAGLGKVKSNLDSGCFQAIQEAGITALSLDDSVTDDFARSIRNDAILWFQASNSSGLRSILLRLHSISGLRCRRDIPPLPSRLTCWRKPES